MAARVRDRRWVPSEQGIQTPRTLGREEKGKGEVKEEVRDPRPNPREGVKHGKGGERSGPVGPPRLGQAQRKRREQAGRAKRNPIG